MSEQPKRPDPSTIFSSITPDYQNPPTLELLRRRAASFTVESPGTIHDLLIIQRDLLARIETLEGALQPFTIHGMAMAQAKMMQIASGRPNNPGGGTWLSTIDNITCAATEKIFYDAIDAFGRAEVERIMAETLLNAQRGAQAVEERDEAEETVH